MPDASFFWHAFMSPICLCTLVVRLFETTNTRKAYPVVLSQCVSVLSHCVSALPFHNICRKVMRIQAE